MKMFILAFVASLPLMSSALTLSCKISINLKPVSTVSVNTVQDSKVAVTAIDGTSIWLTERANLSFDLESFVPDYDARLYSSGSLASKDSHLGQSIWGRDRLLEVDCTSK